MNGLVGEILYLNKKLDPALRNQIERDLMIEYGIITSCTHSGSSAGYDLSSCDVSGGIIPASDCSVTCDTGYTAVTGISPSAVCNTHNSTFEFNGCNADAVIAALQALQLVLSLHQVVCIQ